MRKLKLQVQMTIDGFVAGPNGEMDWMWIGELDNAIYKDVIELADSCDLILLGRNMTTDFIKHWENVLDNHPESIEHPLAQRMVNIQKIVFSNSQSSIKGRNLETKSGDVARIVRELKQQPGKDIMVYGGASFAASLVSQDLVDEFYIFRKPVAIGKGMPIFNKQVVLKYENSTVYTDGTILAKYVPAKR